MHTRPSVRRLIGLVSLCGFVLPAFAQQPAAPIRPAGSPAAQPADAPKPAKPRLYDESADVKALIAAAVAKAKKENQRVLVQWGGNWCGWCIRLDDCMKKDRDIARTLQYEYVVVHADSGVPDGKNIDLATSYGADLKKHGFPYLTVLDGEGKAIANQDTGSLEVGDAHDPAKVLAFLKQHVAKPADAQAALDAALKAAAAKDQAVFLHFGAPWCGWCHRLEDWMARPEVAKLLEKEFIDLKIDIDRMTGGKEILRKYRGEKESGIPWFAFIDAQGKTLTTSEGPQGNVGFPAAPEEIAHFESMLARAARRLTKDEQRALIDSLRADRKPAAPAAPHPGG